MSTTHEMVTTAQGSGDQTARGMYRSIETVPVHDVEGLPNPEIGRALDLSLPAVKSRIHRARLFLRRELGAYFDRVKGGQAGRSQPSRRPGRVDNDLVD